MTLSPVRYSVKTTHSFERLKFALVPTGSYGRNCAIFQESCRNQPKPQLNCGLHDQQRFRRRGMPLEKVRYASAVVRPRSEAVGTRSAVVRSRSEVVGTASAAVGTRSEVVRSRSAAVGIRSAFGRLGRCFDTTNETAMTRVGRNADALLLIA